MVERKMDSWMAKAKTSMGYIARLGIELRRGVNKGRVAT